MQGQTASISNKAPTFRRRPPAASPLPWPPWRPRNSPPDNTARAAARPDLLQVLPGQSLDGHRGRILAGLVQPEDVQAVHRPLVAKVAGDGPRLRRRPQEKQRQLPAHAANHLQTTPRVSGSVLRLALSSRASAAAIPSRVGSGRCPPAEVGGHLALDGVTSFTASSEWSPSQRVVGPADAVLAQQPLPQAGQTHLGGGARSSWTAVPAAPGWGEARTSRSSLPREVRRRAGTGTSTAARVEAAGPTAACGWTPPTWPRWAGRNKRPAGGVPASDRKITAASFTPGARRSTPPPRPAPPGDHAAAPDRRAGAQNQGTAGAGAPIAGAVQPLLVAASGRRRRTPGIVRRSAVINLGQTPAADVQLPACPAAPAVPGRPAPSSWSPTASQSRDVPASPAASSCTVANTVASVGPYSLYRRACEASWKWPGPARPAAIRRHR